MKRKITTCVVIVVILIVCFIGINSIIKNVNNSETAKPITNENITQLRYTVSKDFIENTVKLKGTVVNHNVNDVVIVEATVENGSKVIFKCGVYDDVKEGDVIFTLGSKEYKSSVSGKVKEIINEENYVKVAILNFGDILIDAEVNYVFLDKMRINDTVIVKEINPISDQQVFNEKIVGFGFEVDENLIPVYLSNTRKFMPGTEFEIEYKYKNEKESCYILKEMLLMDISGYYVFVEEKGNRVKREVTLGTEFASYNDDVKVEFVEILSGVNDGETLVIDVIE